jgi:steroid delta-isomerase-like uncharacterized protein
MSLADQLRQGWAGTSADSAAPLEALLAPDYVRHSDTGPVDHDGFIGNIEELYAAFPDLEIEILDTVEQGDRVAHRWESTGTHSGTFMGVPPTHKRIVARGMTISRFDDEGRIAEDWTSWDKASVLHSLGIIPLR